MPMMDASTKMRYFFWRAHLRNSPLSLLMIGDNYLKQLVYKFFWKQLVQLIKTTSSFTAAQLRGAL